MGLLSLMTAACAGGPGGLVHVNTGGPRPQVFSGVSDRLTVHHLGYVEQTYAIVFRADDGTRIYDFDAPQSVSGVASTLLPGESGYNVIRSSWPANKPNFRLEIYQISSDLAERIRPLAQSDRHHVVPELGAPIGSIIFDRCRGRGRRTSCLQGDFTIEIYPGRRGLDCDIVRPDDYRLDCEVYMAQS